MYLINCDNVGTISAVSTWLAIYTLASMLAACSLPCFIWRHIPNKYTHVVHEGPDELVEPTPFFFWNAGVISPSSESHEVITAGYLNLELVQLLWL
jgi:hypothetical protein